MKLIGAIALSSVFIVGFVLIANYVSKEWKKPTDEKK